MLHGLKRFSAEQKFYRIRYSQTEGDWEYTRTNVLVMEKMIGLNVLI